MTRRAVEALACAAIAAGLALSPGQAAAPGGKILAAIDLAKPFGTRSAWRFTAVQAPDENDPDFGPQPGAITFCLKRMADKTCSALGNLKSTFASGYEIGWGPHYLRAARMVYPRGKAAPPLLLLQTASELSANNNAAEYTHILAYRPASDRFEPIFNQVVGHNNNEEIRFIDSGRLRGDVIVVAPVEHSPWGYWVTVHRLDASYRYRQILRYRSATQYADNNRLAVIDSEMPDIQYRLGIWRPGQPLPLPAKGCVKPRLVKMELWCS